MISYVKGTVAYIGNDCIVVDNNGIGYNIQVSSSTASAVVMEKEVQIYTYMNVKENELSLFGFLTKEELNMFNLLISVNGVGPKSAVAMLGALSPSQLALAIATEDIKALSVGQGIGKKIAQRIALELKDKVGADTITTGIELVQKVDVATGERAEALSALMALGFTKNEAQARKDHTYKALSQFLRPEFLGRIDEIVTFRQLDEKDYEKIAALMLQELVEPMKEKGITFGWDEAVLALIAKEAYGNKSGARDLRRVIRRQVEDPICTLLVEQVNGQVALVKAIDKDGKIEIVSA